MNIKDKIDYINSLRLDERINHWQGLVSLANEYLSSEDNDDSQSLELISCLGGLRASRFIQSDVDMELLNVSLLIARKLKSQRKTLISILNDVLYYSNFYPEKYNKIELEKELNKLKQ